MLSSRFAGIPISPSIIDEAGLPQLLACGEQTLRAENPAQAAGFKSKSVAGLNRNSQAMSKTPNGGMLMCELAVIWRIPANIPNGSLHAG
jgi:hypothetical protein